MDFEKFKKNLNQRGLEGFGGQEISLSESTKYFVLAKTEFKAFIVLF